MEGSVADTTDRSASAYPAFSVPGTEQRRLRRLRWLDRNFALSRGSPAAGARGFSTRDLATIAFFHWRAMLLGLLVPLVLAGGASLMMGTTYEAEARLLVLVGRDYLGDGESNQASASPMPDQARLVQTELELLSSNAAIAAAVQAVGPKALVASGDAGFGHAAEAALQAEAQRIGRRVRLSVAPNSNIIRVQFSHADPAVAAQFVNLLVEAYLDQRRRIFTRAQSLFLAEQRDQSAGRLLALEAQAETLRRARRIVDVAQERALLLARQQELAVTSRVAGMRRRVLALEIETQDRQLARLPTEVVTQRETTRQPLHEYRRGVLLSLEEERRRLAGQHPPGAAPLADLDRRIAVLSAATDRDGELASEQRRLGRSGQHEQLSLERARRAAEASGLPATMQDLTAAKVEVDARLAELELADMELAQLSRQRRIEEQSYLDYARRTEDARVQEDAARRREANVRLIEPALPSARGRSLALNILVAGLAIGLLLAPLMVLVATQLRRVFLLPIELERALDQPLLASFWAPRALSPATPTTADARRQRTGLSATARLARCRPTAPMAANAGRQRANLSAAARLAHRLLAQRIPEQPTGLVLHLSAPAEARTATAEVGRLLALVMAEMSGEAVLLLDHGPALEAQMAHFLAAEGLELPMPAPDDLAPLPPGLWRVTGSQLYLADQAALDGWSASRDPFDQLRERFGLTIVNGSGFDGDAHSLMVAASADAAILLVAAESTEELVARDLLGKLEDLGCPALGAVLVNRRQHIPALLYRLI